jgi:TolA-binding protein
MSRIHGLRKTENISGAPTECLFGASHGSILSVFACGLPACDHTRPAAITDFLPRVSSRRRISALFALVTLILTPGGAFAGSESAESQSASDVRAYHSANGLLNRGLYELAIEEYESFLSERPKHEKAPVARYGLGVCHFRLNRFAEAAETLERIGKDAITPFDVEIDLLKGRSYLALGAFEKAIPPLSRIVVTKPGHALAPDATVGWIEALYRLGRFDDVIERYRRFEEIKNSSERVADDEATPTPATLERALYFQSLAYVSLRKNDEAAASLERFLREFPESDYRRQIELLAAQAHHANREFGRAEALYRRVLEANGAPSSEAIPDALFGLASLLATTARPADAAPLLQQFLDHHGEHRIADAARLLAGRIAFDLGDYVSARGHFASLSETGANGSQAAGQAHEAKYYLAKIDLRTGKYTEAARRFGDLDGALSEDVQLAPEVRFDLGVARFHAAEFEQAKSAFGRFLEAFPNHPLVPDALRLTAFACHRLDLYDESLARCREFTKRFETHEGAAEIAFLAAENSFLTKRYAESADGFRAFLEKYPDHADATKATYRLATALYRGESPEQSLPVWRQVLQDAASVEFKRSAHEAVGSILFDRGDWRSAAEAIQEFIDLADASAAEDAMLKLGLCQEHLQEFESALSTFESLLQSSPTSPHRHHAMFEQAQCLVALGRKDESAGVFRRIIAEAPDSRFAPYARTRLGAFALDSGDFDTALSELERIKEDAPRSVRAGAKFNRAQALLAVGDFEKALKALAQFIHDFPEAEQAPQARSQIVIALARMNRCEDALIEIGAILEHESSPTAPIHIALAYENAHCLASLGQSEKAISAFDSLLKLNPDSATLAHALLELAELHAGRAACDMAIPLLEQLDDLATSDSDAVPEQVHENGMFRWAACQHELNDFGSAAELFERFLAAFPDSGMLASALAFAGESRMKSGSIPQAASHFERVVENFGDAPSHAACLLRLGECRASLQQWTQSEAAFDSYLDAHADSPHAPKARFGVGFARENMKRYAEAIDAYQKVIESTNEDAAARSQFQIGECHFAQGQYVEAIRAFLKVDIHYAYPEWSAAALYEAGRCFEKRNQIAEAREQFADVRDRFASTKWASMAADRLESMNAPAPPGQGSQ